MYWHTYNYLKRDGRQSRWQWVNVGFWVRLPRLMLLCRVFGHRPVVDGHLARRTKSGYVGQAYLWVSCDRCGVRSEPQGSLDPDVYRLGQRYRGPWGPRINDLMLKQVKPDLPLLYKPGPMEAAPTGKLGGQLVIGGGVPGWGWDFKVGHPGSEQTLAASVSFGRLGALYLHTERFGTWLVRRFNLDRGEEYQSRVTGVRIGHDRVEWRLWVKRDNSSPVYPVTLAYNGVMRLAGRLLRFAPPQARTGCRLRSDVGPWWRHGAVCFNLLDKLLGPKLYSYTPVAETTRMLLLPEAEYLVKLELKRVVRGRKRGFKPKSEPWMVDWEALGKGIPERSYEDWKGPVFASSVEVSRASLKAGTWPAEATAAIAVQVAKWRTRHGWEPIGRVPVDPDAVVVA